jgi:hypothetical protein
MVQKKFLKKKSFEKAFKSYLKVFFNIQAVFLIKEELIYSSNKPKNGIHL